MSCDAGGRGVGIAFLPFLRRAVPFEREIAPEMHFAAVGERELDVGGVTLARLGRANGTADARGKYRAGIIIDRRDRLCKLSGKHRTDRQRERDDQKSDERYQCKKAYFNFVHENGLRNRRYPRLVLNCLVYSTQIFFVRQAVSAPTGAKNANFAQFTRDGYIFPSRKTSTAFLRRAALR